MFKGRKQKKGRADEVLEYEGATSLESNLGGGVRNLDNHDMDHNVDHDHDPEQDLYLYQSNVDDHQDPEVERSKVLHTDDVGSSGGPDVHLNLNQLPEPEHVDPAIKKMRKGLAKMSEKDLFNAFHAFQPVELSLETIYVPFLPDYTPSIGDVDPFIKIPRPDNKVEVLGLVVLDDPCINQSDATVLNLQLKDTAKTVKFSMEDLAASGGDTSHDLHVRKDATKMILSSDDLIKQVTNTKKNVDSWIQKIEELHGKIGMNTEYTYSLTIPTTLMNLWEPQFIELLEKVDLPSASIDLTTEEYARVVCSILDIPIGDNLIESLHMLFTNYMDVQDNIKLAQHGML